MYLRTANFVEISFSLRIVLGVKIVGYSLAGSYGYISGKHSIYAVAESRSLELFVRIEVRYLCYSVYSRICAAARSQCYFLAEARRKHSLYFALHGRKSFLFLKAVIRSAVVTNRNFVSCHIKPPK